MTNIDNNVNIPQYNLPVGQIIQSGGSANNFYIKFSNGIMICCGFTTFEVDFSTTIGQLYRYSKFSVLTFAQRFTSIYSVTCTTGSTVDYSFCMVYSLEYTLSGITRVDLVRPISQNNSTTTLQYMAIGTWK